MTDQRAIPGREGKKAKCNNTQGTKIGDGDQTVASRLRSNNVVFRHASINGFFLIGSAIDCDQSRQGRSMEEEERRMREKHDWTRGAGCYAPINYFCSGRVE